MAIFGNDPKNPMSTRNQNDPRKKKTGTGFTNIQKLIGASSGQKLGETIGSGISGQAQQFKGQLGQEQQQFGQKLGEASSVFNPNKRDEVIKTAGAAGEPSEEQVKQFQTYLGGQLGDQSLGKGLQGFGKLAAGATDLSQQLKNIESTGGRYNLLQRYASGGKQYNPGARRLDALLLGQSGGDQALQQARLGNVGLGQQLKQAQEGAKAQFGEAAGKAKQFADETGKALTGSMSEVEAAVDLKNKQKATQDLYGKSQADIQKLFETGEIDEATANMLGLPTGQEYLYDLNPLQFQQTMSLDPSKTQFASQFATKEQDARMRALAKLGNKDIAGWGDKATVGEAANAISTNQEQLKKILSDKEAEYQRQLKGETGETVKGLTPEQLRASFATESGRYAREMMAAGIDPNVQKQVNDAIGGAGQNADTAYYALQNEVNKLRLKVSEAASGNKVDGLTYPELVNRYNAMTNIANTMGSLRDSGQQFKNWETSKLGKRIKRTPSKT